MQAGIQLFTAKKWLRKRTRGKRKLSEIEKDTKMKSN